MNKLKFSLKKEKDEEEKNFNIKVIMNSNSKDYLNRHKNTNLNNNYYMTNKIIFLSPNKYSNNNKTKEFSLKPQKKLPPMSERSFVNLFKRISKHLRHPPNRN